MPTVVEVLIADLTAQTDDLDALVAGLPPDQWSTPTPAVGWSIAHQIGHLAWTDRLSVIAATDPERFQSEVVAEAVNNALHAVDDAAAAEAARPPQDILADWRSGRTALNAALLAVPEGTKLPWFGPPMSAASMATARLMETWAHGLDVADALGQQLPQTERMKGVVHIGVRTRDFAYLVNGQTPPAEPFRYEITSPAGQLWTWGPADADNIVRAPAFDFCALVTQRRAVADLDVEFIGVHAQQWSLIAQTFAGPPGAGRAPATVRESAS